MDDLPSWLLTQTAQYAQRIIGDGFAASGARGYHFRLLRALDGDGPASQAALGRRTGIHLSDMVAALNELEGGAYVARSPDPDDRRRNIITITAAGRTRLTELTATVLAIQDELLAPLSPAERADLVTLLGKILSYHREPNK